MKPTVIDLAAALLAILEGERLTAYKDSGGVWTIGFGHTKGVEEGQTITHQQAVDFMLMDSFPLFQLVSGLPSVKAAALVSFGYNVGKAALQNVLAGTDSIDNPRHTTDRHGVVQPGLVARRRLEKMLVDLGA